MVAVSVVTVFVVFVVDVVFVVIVILGTPARYKPNFYNSKSSRMSFVSLFMILEAVSLIFRWCATRRSPGVGSVEGGVVVGRRLRTLHTKATHELAKESCYMEAAQSGGRQRGLGCAGWRPRGDPWGGGPSTLPLAKLYSAALNSSSSLRLFPFLR